MATLIRYLFMALTAYWLIKYIYIRIRALSSSGAERYQSDSSQQTSDKPLDPYDVLGLTRPASAKDIKRAYHETLAKYHPDKVEHLGEEIKKVAIEKTHQIQKAYDQLKS
jgi:preprotein translocase subunit Sec63